MRIAYLVNQYPSLSHTFIRREIRVLESLGHSIDRFTIRKSPTRQIDEDDREETLRTTVLLKIGPCLLAMCRHALFHPLRFLSAAMLAMRFRRNSDKGLLHHFAYLAQACRLAAELNRLKAEWLHAHFGTNPATVASICRQLGGPPFSFTVHGPEEFDRPLTESLGLKIELAEMVVAVSNYGRSQLQRWCDFKQWNKLEVVRCGVERPLLQSSSTPIPANNRIVCVGRLVEQKGHMTLLKSLTMLAAENIDFELVLVGDGPLREAIEEYVRSAGLSARVTITGWQSGAQVIEHLEQSRCLALPSFAEGLPVVIMEAFAMGRPVISTYIAGIPELVENGTNGWLTAASDAEGLAEAIKQCLATPASQLELLAQNGKAKVRTLHSVELEASKLAEAITRYLAR